MANTTNLNLAKPAGTDKALVSVLNSNSDKIDAWAGSTNQAITTLNSNLASFMNRFDGAFHQAPNDLNDAKESGFYLSTSGTNRPTDGWNIIIVARAYHDTSGDVLVQISHNISGNGTFIRGLNGKNWQKWKMISLA